MAAEIFEEEEREEADKTLTKPRYNAITVTSWAFSMGMSRQGKGDQLCRKSGKGDQLCRQSRRDVVDGICG